jgi:hypothetical protein
VHPADRPRPRGPAGRRGSPRRGKLIQALRWQLTRNHDPQKKAAEAGLREWLRRKGRKIPDELREEPTQPPTLDADLVPVWEAWAVLMDGRNVSDGEGLSWLELSRWCEDHGIEGASRRRWCRLLKAMDRAYVAHISEVHSGRGSRTGSGRAPDGAGRGAGEAGDRLGQ